MEESIILYPDLEIGVMLSGKRNADSRFCFLVLTGEKFTAQPCFSSVIDLLLSVTSGSSTSSLILVIFFVDAEGAWL